MKTIISSVLLCLLLMLPIVSRADAEPNALIIERSDGWTYTYLLKKRPLITFEGNTMLINGELLCDVADISSYRFEYVREDGVAAVGDREIQIVRIALNQYKLSGLEPGETVRIFSLTGRIMTIQNATSDGEINVNLCDFAHGMYIIQLSDSKTIKIIKK